MLFRVTVHLSAALATMFLALAMLVNFGMQSAFGRLVASYPEIQWLGPLLAIPSLILVVLCAIHAYKDRHGWWLVAILFGTVLGAVLYYWFVYRNDEARLRVKEEVETSPNLKLPPLTKEQRG